LSVFIRRKSGEGGHVYRVGQSAALSSGLSANALEPRFGKLGREYKNIVFDKEHLKRDPTLEWVTPGHPLFEAVREDVTEHVREDLAARRGVLRPAPGLPLTASTSSRRPSRTDATTSFTAAFLSCRPTKRHDDHSPTDHLPRFGLAPKANERSRRRRDARPTAAERFLVTTALNPFPRRSCTRNGRVKRHHRGATWKSASTN
jgi:hypothetical protein